MWVPGVTHHGVRFSGSGLPVREDASVITGEGVFDYIIAEIVKNTSLKVNKNSNFFWFLSKFAKFVNHLILVKFY